MDFNFVLGSNVFFKVNKYSYKIVEKMLDLV